MDRKRLLVGIAGVLSTLRELTEAPGGLLYAALMGAGWSFDEFSALQGVMVDAGLVTVWPTHLWTLTEKGRATAEKVDAAAAAAGRAVQA